MLCLIGSFSSSSMNKTFLPLLLLFWTLLLLWSNSKRKSITYIKFMTFDKWWWLFYTQLEFFIITFIIHEIWFCFCKILLQLYYRFVAILTIFHTQKYFIKNFLQNILLVATQISFYIIQFLRSLLCKLLILSIQETLMYE